MVKDHGFRRPPGVRGNVGFDRFPIQTQSCWKRLLGICELVPSGRPVTPMVGAPAKARHIAAVDDPWASQAWDGPANIPVVGGRRDQADYPPGRTTHCGCSAFFQSHLALGNRPRASPTCEPVGPSQRSFVPLLGSPLREWLLGFWVCCSCCGQTREPRVPRERVCPPPGCPRVPGQGPGGGTREFHQKRFLPVILM